MQVLRVLQTYCLGLALGLTVPLGIYFALVPIILLIVLMPITINGIGTTQAGFVWLFGRAGVASAPAFALSVLFLAIAIVGNLPGGLAVLIRARCFRFSADARTRNLTYGATCFTAATFIWHGLRQVGHFFSFTQSRCSWLLARKYSSSASSLSTLPDHIAVLAEEHAAVRDSA